MPDSETGAMGDRKRKNNNFTVYSKSAGETAGTASPNPGLWSPRHRFSRGAPRTELHIVGPGYAGSLQSVLPPSVPRITSATSADGFPKGHQFNPVFSPVLPSAGPEGTTPDLSTAAAAALAADLVGSPGSASEAAVGTPVSSPTPALPEGHSPPVSSGGRGVQDPWNPSHNTDGTPRTLFATSPEARRRTAAELGLVAPFPGDSVISSPVQPFVARNGDFSFPRVEPESAFAPTAAGGEAGGNVRTSDLLVYVRDDKKKHTLDDGDV